MWRLRPGISLRVREEIRPYAPEPSGAVAFEWTIETNRLGTRGPEVDDKVAGRLRVLCIGDSRTLGEGLDQASTYPARLANATGADVINAGADGYSAYQGRRYLETDGFQLEPDVVIACFGINDSDRAWGLDDRSRGRSLDSVFTTVQSLLYRSMVFYAASRAYLRGRAVLLGGTQAGDGYGIGPPRLTPAAYAEEIALMRDLCARRGVRFLYAILPVNPYYPWQRHVEAGGPTTPFVPYNEAAISGSVDMIDLRDSFGERPEGYFIDDMHLSAAGADLVARHLARVIDGDARPR